MEGCVSGLGQRAGHAVVKRVAQLVKIHDYVALAIDDRAVEAVIAAADGRRDLHEAGARGTDAYNGQN